MFRRFWRFERKPTSACNCWHYTSYRLGADAPNPTLSAKHTPTKTGQPVYLAERALCLEPDRHASRSSQVTGLQKNPDSSVDLHIGPHSPPGKAELDSEKKAGGRFEAILRF
jgi:hypothetical protein